MDVEAYERGTVPADVAAGVHRTRLAAFAVDEPERPPPAAEDTAALLAVRRRGAGGLHFVARAGGDVVGYARLGLPGRDNTHLGFLDPVVHPDARRRGAGTALMRAGLGALAADGRRTLLVETRPDGPGAAFCDALGLEVAQSQQESLLALSAVDRGDVESLAAADHPGYRLAAWSDRSPDELLESYAAAKAAMNDAPVGGLDWEGLRYSADRQRENEEVAVQLGQEYRFVAAVHAGSGAVAALTELLISRWSPHRAEQDDTAVVPAHRGHGLGLWVKAEMLRRLLAERPDVRQIITYNAEDNAHMWRINARLGFRPHATVTERQGRVADLAALLAVGAAGGQQP